MGKGTSGATPTWIGFRGQNRLVEYGGGQGDSLVFPGMYDCVAVFGMGAAGLCGAHISPGSSKSQFKTHLKQLAAHGSDVDKWFVVGNFRQHFDAPLALHQSHRELIDALRGALPGAMFQGLDSVVSYGEFTTDITVTKVGHEVGIEIVQEFKDKDSPPAYTRNFLAHALPADE